MTVDEFLDRVRSEVPVAFELDVGVASPEMLSDVQRRGRVRLTDWMSDPRQTTERRVVRRGHVLGAGASPEVIAGWRVRWPEHPLPADLVELISRINGVHLWADLDTGRSYDGLAPITDRRATTRHCLVPTSSLAQAPIPYMALSYNADHAAFLVLNADTGEYFLMDSAGADESCRIGRSSGELLDWLWSRRLAPSAAGTADALA